jgi:hypothetical protein
MPAKEHQRRSWFLLRLPPVAHAGAIRAQLKQQKKLKLKVPKRVGKAYTEEEKLALVTNAKGAKRSRDIHLATMLASTPACATKKCIRCSGID